MKNTLFSLLLSVAILTAFTTSSFAQKSADEVAVQHVLNASQAAFDKRDLTAFSALFVKSPYLYYQVYATDGKVYMANGWESMTHMVGGYMKDNPKPSVSKLSGSNIHVSGNTAWVHATTHWGNAGQKNQSRDLLIMEKQAGQWKIAVLTSQEYTDKKLVVVK